MFETTRILASYGHEVNCATRGRLVTLRVHEPSRRVVISGCGVVDAWEEPLRESAKRAGPGRGWTGFGPWGAERSGRVRAGSWERCGTGTGGQAAWVQGRCE
jgi:hypothetical protein